MAFLLDTDTISYYSKRHPFVSQKVTATPPEEMCISVISAMEITYGYATNRQARESHEYRYQGLFELVNLIPYEGTDSYLTAMLRAELKASGLKIAHYDALLAGTALARDLVFVTNNTKHFSAIQGLKLENWTQP